MNLIVLFHASYISYVFICIQNAWGGGGGVAYTSPVPMPTCFSLVAYSIEEVVTV